MRSSLKNAVAGEAGREVGGAQNAARAFLAVGRRGGEIVEELALVPDVIAGGHAIGAEVEEVFGDVGGHAESAGGVFDIHDEQVDLVCFAHVADVFADDFASCAAEDVADEEDVQVRLLASSL